MNDRAHPHRTTRSARRVRARLLAGALAAATALTAGIVALTAAPAAAAGFEIGRTPFYGKVPTLGANSRTAFWYGALDQAKVNQLKAYDLVVLEPTLRVLNVTADHFYFESVTSAQVQEIKRGVDGVLGSADDAIVLGYLSVGEMLPTIIPGHSGHMTVQKGIDLGLLPAGYGGPSGPLHGPNPWNYSSSGSYLNVEGGATPDGTYADGYANYAGTSIGANHSSWGNRLTWRNNGVMPWYLDQQGTWVNDSRYLYGGYWKDGDGTVDVNPTYGGGYINGGDPAWQKFVTYQVDKIVHDGDYDGVFLDTVDTPDPVGGAGPGISWGPRGNFGFTAGGMVDLVEKIKAVDPSKVVASNRGYWYFNPDEGTSQFAARYRHAINIFVTESWYYNTYIPGFYDTSPGFEANWNTNSASPTYRSRDNFGGFWKEYVNAQANQADGFNVAIIDFRVPAASTQKWMNEVVVNSGYLGYDVSGANHFNSAVYDDAKNWLDAQGLASPSQTGAHPTDLYGGFVADGSVGEWSAELPIFNDPAGANAKGITKVYVKFVGNRFFMMVEAKQTISLAQEMIYFDYDKDGPAGWQPSWPTSPDSRLYLENLNQAYLLPHAGAGQGDVFKFSSPSAPTNRGWPVRVVQSGTRAEFEFDRDYVFPASMAGTEVWTWLRVANFGGSSVKFTVPGGGAPPSPSPTPSSSPPPAQPPVISNVQYANVTSTGATVTWTTDVASSSVVEYGTSTAYGSTATGASNVTSHSVTLSGLSPGTAYQFRVRSASAGGTTNSPNGTFTTGSSGGSYPAITVDGAIGDWGSITAVMTGSTTVQSVSIANNAANLYLLTRGTGLNVFGQFFLNTDNNPATGYNATGWSNPSGADYMLENGNLYRHAGGGWAWTSLGAVTFVRNDTAVEAAIPLSTLSLSPGAQLRAGYLKNSSATDRLPAASGTFPVVTLLNGSGGGGGAPVISNVQYANVTSTGATVTWTTDVASSSVVEYGTSTAYGSTATGASNVTSHSVTLSGLSAGTAYQFRARSVSAGGTTNSPNGTFTTGSSGGSYPAITIDGSAGDWAGVNPVLSGGTGVQSVSVTNNGTTLYLCVKGTGLNVLGQFFLNTDNNTGTGYNAAGWTNPSGGDYMLENANLYDHGGSGWAWTPLGAMTFVRNDTVIEAAVPLASVGLAAGAQFRVGYIKNNTTDRLPAASGTFPVVTLLN
ncbi:fibronectin type III domain-containing protein [Catellatospora vulcania]|uniref:fibronectin type III domain-containing protein n=1 Tax=Catellatospora vulcania TaxID=1460450 RepID=UPI0012D3D139|nr:fibronectin type III domain-containing protein [Catellatospora vulcania]